MLLSPGAHEAAEEEVGVEEEEVEHHGRSQPGSASQQTTQGRAARYKRRYDWWVRTDVMIGRLEQTL